jgi:hypothetical protein
MILHYARLRCDGIGRLRSPASVVFSTNRGISFSLPIHYFGIFHWIHLQAIGKTKNGKNFLPIGLLDVVDGR